jgi:hypothetical protein
LFELYAQGDRTKRSLGLGLGLYLCRQIIQAHGGEIGVTSTPNVGSKFWFTFQATLYPAKLCIDLAMALKAAKTFSELGTMTKSVVWEQDKVLELV